MAKLILEVPPEIVDAVRLPPGEVEAELRGLRVVAFQAVLRQEGANMFGVAGIVLRGRSRCDPRKRERGENEDAVHDDACFPLAG